MAFWFVTRPRAFGVHAIALDAGGKVILVRHTYANGWRLPGGGMKRGERPRDAILRELREEIGLTSHGSVTELLTLTHRPEFRRGTAYIFKIEAVLYQPRQSIEIEEIAAFAPDVLPLDASPLTRRLVAAAEAGEAAVEWP